MRLLRADCRAGRFDCPGLSSYIAEDLGLKTPIRFLELMGMVCGAAIPNLEAATGMLARSGEGPVLGLAVEICSTTIFPSHEPELVVSNPIFGDGAAAAVFDLSREGHQGGLAQMVDFEAGLFPRYREDLRYRTEGGRLRNQLSKRVPVIGAHTATEVASRLLARHGLSRNDIAWWAVHPGGTVVLAAFGKGSFWKPSIGLDVLEEGFYADQSNHCRAGKECACSGWHRTPPWGKLSQEESL